MNCQPLRRIWIRHYVDPLRRQCPLLVGFPILGTTPSLQQMRNRPDEKHSQILTKGKLAANKEKPDKYPNKKYSSYI